MILNSQIGTAFSPKIIVQNLGWYDALHEMTNPLNASFSIRLFGNIINTVADNLFNDMLIHTGFLCRGDELKTTIMRTMPGGQGLKHSRRMRCPFCVYFGWRLNDTTGRFTRYGCGEIKR